MKPKKLNSDSDYPPYGKYVLVFGVDNSTYKVKRWHVCDMNDLEDGIQFQKTGEFYWTTENGTIIEDVTHWCELPENPLD